MFWLFLVCTCEDWQVWQVSLPFGRLRVIGLSQPFCFEELNAVSELTNHTN